MFTGLIEAVAEVVDVTTTPGGRRLTLATALAPELRLGDSLAVNGVCLTVVRTGAIEIDADVGPETLRVTTLGSFTKGFVVNLERPLRGDSRMGGHFVQGHVDAQGRIEALRPASDFHWLTVAFPAELARFIVPKGSIAVDGISLTVANLDQASFDVQLVPFTVEHTNLKRARTGDPVNLECDVIGKYVARAAELILKS
jgi:riboflavin synthase